MRIAVVGPTTTHHGADEATTRRHCHASRLAEDGHDVRLFAARWWDGDIQTFETEGLTYEAVTASLDEPDRRFAARVTRRLAAFEPDLVHASERPRVGLLAAAFAATILRVPLLVDWYDHASPDGWLAAVERVTARTPDLVTVPSRLVETRLRELGRADAGTAVLPTGIDLEAVRTVEPDTVADVVYSRSLDASANLESLLLALAELRDLGWTAAVIGDGPLREAYEAQAADLRIDDRVTFLGSEALERRLAIFKGAHVAVHTATYAPFATDFLRALACGCVGIAEYHADSSAHELIEQRERGFRTTNEEELNDAIRAAADLPHQTVGDGFDAFEEDAVHERLLEHYRRLLG